MNKVQLWNTGTKPVICDRRFHKTIQPRRSELVLPAIAADLLKLDFITDKDPADKKEEISAAPDKKERKDSRGSRNNSGNI